LPPRRTSPAPYAHHVLDRVGGGEEASQGLGDLQLPHGQRLLEPLAQAAGGVLLAVAVEPRGGPEPLASVDDEQQALSVLEAPANEVLLPDLRPSVYEVEAGDVVRAYAEHATAFTPPSSAGGIDMGRTDRSVRETPGETGFAFTMRAHREIILQHREDLVGLVREVRVSLTQRTHTATRAQVIDYVRARLDAHDDEWLRARGAEGAQQW
jgi:hypothetical protein